MAEASHFSLSEILSLYIYFKYWIRLFVVDVLKSRIPFPHNQSKAVEALKHVWIELIEYGSAFASASCNVCCKIVRTINRMRAK